MRNLKLQDLQYLAYLFFMMALAIIFWCRDLLNALKIALMPKKAVKRFCPLEVDKQLGPYVTRVHSVTERRRMRR